MPSLEVTPFTEKLLPLVADFDCGSLSYQREVAEWIRGQAPGTVLDAMRDRSRPTLVWLYSTPQNGVVGYGSLCASNWSSVPHGPRDMPIVLIPNLGLKTLFQGYPQGVEREERYSTQIIEHLKHEAFGFQGRLPLLGLFVHPDNTAAQRCYQRNGFVDYPQVYRDPDTDVTYQGMILKLAVPQGIPLVEGGVEMRVANQQSAASGEAQDIQGASRTFEEAVSTLLNAPPTPEQQAKKAAAKARRDERKRQQQASAGEQDK